LLVRSGPLANTAAATAARETNAIENITKLKPTFMASPDTIVGQKVFNCFEILRRS
jgi:hypothetical protein